MSKPTAEAVADRLIKDWMVRHPLLDSLLDLARKHSAYQYDTWEDYEKYGDAFINVKLPTKSETETTVFPLIRRKA